MVIFYDDIKSVKDQEMLPVLDGDQEWNDKEYLAGNNRTNLFKAAGAAETSKVVDINSKLPKDHTVALLNRESEKLIAFLSVESVGRHYRFTNITKEMKKVTWIDAEEIVKDIDASKGTHIPAYDTSNRENYLVSVDGIQIVVAKTPG